MKEPDSPFFSHVLPRWFSSGALALILGLTACGDDGDLSPLSLTELGEKLFFDKNLSKNRTQACATCHDPEHGFVDARKGPDGLVRPTSLGDDGKSLGNRNAPTAAYARFVPEFKKDGERKRIDVTRLRGTIYKGPHGGVFLDGRAAGLAEQAMGPPVNPVEMGMPDAASVVERIKENKVYVQAFKKLFGQDIFNSPNNAYGAMGEAIAAFERTPLFAPFDSRYDRYLRGEIEISFKERSGMALFFGRFANCGVCHQKYAFGDPSLAKYETFSSDEYHNIGTPMNPAVTQTSTLGDVGLPNNPAVATSTSGLGKFRVPTLRNVAVTGPYMHDGSFRDLETVVRFYETYHNLDGSDPDLLNNPETGKPWGPLAYESTISMDELKVGRKMAKSEIKNIVCFMRMLTDKRYEHLIPKDDLNCLE